ncbi:hypothetical protein [uncultured Anaerovibrio sp.]|uniref:hypothetical protein n=1 Tax=uncultured Anaerovibrio sp. TaxID=361586 RepID=UPI002610E671|nr:hypothetical protein [uncultured Anaerovibrio sp.]
MLEKLDTSPQVWIRKSGKEKWHEDNTEALKPFSYTADEISFVIVDEFEKDKRKCWCPKHQNFEFADYTSESNHNIQMESACAFSKYQFTIFPIDDEKTNTDRIIPIRIELTQTDDGHLLRLKVIHVHLKFLKILHWRKLGWDLMPHFSFSEAYYEWDMENGTYHSFPDNNGVEWNVNWEGYDEEYTRMMSHHFVAKNTLPTKIFELVKARIWAYMSAKIAPYKIMWPKNLLIKTLGDLLRLIKHPMDIHISFLEDFSRINEKLENKRSSHSFKDLCKIFNCKPPYSVRKMYGNNPYTFIKYLWLMGLGFKDIEAIVYCMGNHSDWNGSHVRYDFEKNEIIWNENSYWPEKKDIDFYMKWQLKHGVGAFL